MSRSLAAAAKGRSSVVEDLILRLCTEHPDGVSQKDIQDADPSLSVDDVGAAINTLMRGLRLELLQDNSGATFFRGIALEQTQKYKGLTPEELMVFQHIQKSGNTGLWTKDMKARTNLQQPQITKILKQLESRKLIKVVKSVASANRKVYMEWDVEPSREITGGAWYTDHSFDAEFITLLRDVCIGYLRRTPEATLEEILDFVLKKEVTKEPLGNEDFGMILDTLCLDGKVERIFDPSGEDKYTLPALPMMESTALTSMPCGVCPVAAECTPDGAISPATCIYYKEWLY